VTTQDFSQRAADQWGELLPEVALSPDEMAVAVRFSRLYQLQRVLDNKSLRKFEYDGLASVDDFRLLALMRRSDADGLTNGELVAQLGGSKAGMSNRLQRLVQHGHVERLPSPVDRRVHANKLTTQGQELADSAVTAVTTGRKRIFENLTDTAITELATTLATMIHTLDPND